jgi:hypothetical protein
VSAATLIPTTETSPLSPGSFGTVQESPQAVSASSDEIPALVIGDLHGHLDRFEALLKQEGLLDQCEHCDGLGEVWEPCTLPGYQCEYSCEHDYYRECWNCDGQGWARTKKRAKVILVGDVGHFGMNRDPITGQKTPGSATADLLTWRAALNWADVILWGNHDRALVSDAHAFGGYIKPNPEVYDLIERARWEGKLKLAHSTHGFLITHAGLHLAFRDNKNVPDSVKRDPVEFAYWINAVEPQSYTGTPDQLAVRDAIAIKRGGHAHAGGILWRDIEEKLYPEFRQVFGHSADHKDRAVRYCNQWSYTRNPCASISYDNLSYCIDVGGPDEWPGAKCLAGIWLPEERIVRVDL